MTRTILLTGGAGFIGSAMVAALAVRGDKVVVLDKLTYAGHRQNIDGIKGTVELVVGDIADGALVTALFAKHAFNAVIHAAAESHVDNSISGSTPFIQTNILGTHMLLEAARNAPRTHDFRFIQVSTDEVYGALGDKGVFTRDTLMQPNSPYAASKASADHLARSWFRTYGLPTIITRCCNNYGPRQHPEKLIPRMIINALKGEKLPVYGEGKQIREWIHADDHARGVLAALDRGVPGEVYHLGSGEEMRNLALVTLLCDLLAKERPGRDYHALITHVADRLGHDYRYALDIESSHRALGFKPSVAFEQGLKDTLRWYLANDAWVETMVNYKGERRAA